MTDEEQLKSMVIMFNSKCSTGGPWFAVVCFVMISVMMVLKLEGHVSK
jgi:hypothetical protein